MQNKPILATLARMGRTVSVYLVMPAWIAALVLMFSDASPATASTTFQVVFLGFVILPAAVNVTVLVLLAIEKTNDAVAESKIVSNAALLSLMPATLTLPADYWLVYALAALLIAARIVIEMRLRTINPERRMVVSRHADHDDETSDSAEGATSHFMFEAVTAELTLADLAGMEDLKERLIAAANEARQMIPKGKGKGLRANARNGILLYSEPGNGKTVLTEGLAGTLGLPIIKMSFGDVASKWVNSTTENVVQMFKDARAQAPCVLFMDEVDSVISKREGITTDEESPKTTNQILTELVNSRGSGVVIVMATNFLDRLDAAAIREGRVDFKINVPAPDAAARNAIITRTIKAAGVPAEKSAIAQAVKRWEGFSAARIRSVADEAARLSKKEGLVLDYDLMQKALRVMQGSLGIRLDESTPTLSELHMPEQQRLALVGVAKRMAAIEEIEDMGGTVPTGLLLAGPPGTGKTLTVRALAKTTGWPLLMSGGADLMNDPKNIDQLISKARNARPCIVFIDEADDVFSDRRAAGKFGAAITNKLLTAMDGAGGKAHDILWVAAVNAPETMDAAALRGGRFTEKVWFENPDSTTTERIIQQWISKSKAKFDPQLSAKEIASMLDGVSPANIQAILQQAVNIMIAIQLEAGGSGRAVTRREIEKARTDILG